MVDERLALLEGNQVGFGTRERSVRVQMRHRALHRQHRGLQRGVGVEDASEAELGQPLSRQHRGLAAEDDVAEMRARKLLRDSLELLLRDGRLHEEQVGTRLAIGVGPIERRLEAFHGASVRTRDDQEVPVVASVDRGLHLLDHLREGDHGLALEMSAALGEDLILELDRARAGALVEAKGAVEVQRIAESGVAVRHDRDLHSIANPRHVHRHLGRRGEPHVGRAQMAVRDARARQIDRLEARALDDPGREGMSGSWDQDTRSRCEQGAELLVQ